MSIGSSLASAIAALESVPAANWTAALQAGLKDAQAKLPIEQDALDGLKAVLPQYAFIADLAELYFAAGGKPADGSSLVFKRQDPSPYDPNFGQPGG